MNYELWFQLASPEIVLSLSSLVLLLIAAWGGVQSSRLVSVLTVVALFGALALSFNFLLNPSFAEGADAFYGQYRMDRFASLSKILVFLSAIGCIIVAPKFFARGNLMRPEYPILILFASIGMGLMVSAVDLLTLYVGLEMQSLAAYVLASFLRSDDRSAEAGLKYFVLGALASGILLFGMSLLYAYVMSYLHISQSAAAAIVAMQLSPWLLLLTILALVIALGFFLPPVSIILMTAPIILPPLKAAGFDLVWFGVVMTITMEMGLIHPPVGLNIFVIKNIAPDIPLSDIIWGTLPFVILMAVAILILCLVPGIALWLPDLLLATTR